MKFNIIVLTSQFEIHTHKLSLRAVLWRSNLETMKRLLRRPQNQDSSQ